MDCPLFPVRCRYVPNSYMQDMQDKLNVLIQPWSLWFIFTHGINNINLSTRAIQCKQFPVPRAWPEFARHTDLERLRKTAHFDDRVGEAELAATQSSLYVKAVSVDVE